MISFRQFIGLIKESAPLPQYHDINGLKRFFPELMKGEKRTKNLVGKTPHDVQKQKKKKRVAINKDGTVLVNEARNFTVVGRFGEKKYKNIKQAQKHASVPVRKPQVKRNINLAPSKNLYISQEKINKLNTSTGYKQPKPVLKFKQFAAKVRTIATNPIHVGRVLAKTKLRQATKTGINLVKNLTKTGSTALQTISKPQNVSKPVTPKLQSPSLSSVPKPVKVPKVPKAPSSVKVPKTTVTPQKTAGTVLGSISPENTEKETSTTPQVITPTVKKNPTVKKKTAGSVISEII